MRGLHKKLVVAFLLLLFPVLLFAKEQTMELRVTECTT